jgi:mRNA-degrading endonuclease YafQ of YafQ-DinJ toxin-antitoxin module
MKDFIVHLSTNFDKKFKKLVKSNKALKKEIFKSLETLSSDPFYSSLRTHKVFHRVYGLSFSSRITGDIRIIWDFDDNNTMVIIALDIGGHDDVYR